MAAIPLWALMAAGGAAKYAGDRVKADSDRGLQASTARYSPWTGLKQHAVKEADLVGDVGSAALAGYQTGQSADLNKAQTEWLNRGGSPKPLWGGGPDPTQSLSAGAPGYFAKDNPYQNSNWANVGRKSNTSLFGN